MNKVFVYRYPDYPGYFRVEVEIDGIILMTGYDTFMLTQEEASRVANRLAKALNCKISIKDDKWITM